MCLVFATAVVWLGFFLISEGQLTDDCSHLPLLDDADYVKLDDDTPFKNHETKPKSLSTHRKQLSDRLATIIVGKTAPADYKPFLDNMYNQRDMFNEKGVEETGLKTTDLWEQLAINLQKVLNGAWYEIIDYPCDSSTSYETMVLEVMNELNTFDMFQLLREYYCDIFVKCENNSFPHEIRLEMSHEINLCSYYVPFRENPQLSCSQANIRVTSNLKTDDNIFMHGDVYSFHVNVLYPSSYRDVLNRIKTIYSVDEWSLRKSFSHFFDNFIEQSDHYYYGPRQIFYPSEVMIKQGENRTEVDLYAKTFEILYYLLTGVRPYRLD